MANLDFVDGLSVEEIMNLDFVIPEIHNPHKLPLVDFRELKPLQETEEGALKDFKRADVARMKTVIMSRGFMRPFTLVEIEEEDGALYLDDGHGRRNLFTHNQPYNTKGKPVYKFPYLKVYAKTKAEAMEQLLENNSSFQEMTQDGFDLMVSYYGLDQEWANKSLKFDRVLTFKEPEAFAGVEEEDDEYPDDALPSHVRMLQLFLNDRTDAEFRDFEKDLRPLFGSESITDTVYEAMKFLHQRLSYVKSETTDAEPADDGEASE